MLGSNKINIMATAFLQSKHEVGDLISRAFTPALALGDVPVLAKHAAQVAHTEKNSTTAVATAQTVLLPKMGKGAGNDSMATGMTDTCLIFQAVDVTVAWTGTTILQIL